MAFLFWLSVFLLFYVYVGYPLLLLAMRPRQTGTAGANSENSISDIEPPATLIISAYNEASVIAAKLDNALALDYPADKLSIIVVSDCSDDGTDDIVSGYADPRVHLLRMDERSGKSIGLNHAVDKAAGEIIVFTDANAMFAPDALKNLIAHFADEEVGVVTGQQRYESEDEGEPTQEGLYWRLESAIKQLESDNGNLVGGDGAIMAIRKALFFQLAEDDLSDYLLPMRIAMQGYRNHYEQTAVCTEEAADSYEKEYRRKVRIVNRAWRATMKSAAVLNPLRYGKLSLFVWSHKVLRWLTAVWMLLAAISTVLLVNEHWIYALALIGQSALYTLALIGYLLRARVQWNVLTIPYYFCSVNFAALQGIIENFGGKTYATWNTPRTTAP